MPGDNIQSVGGGGGAPVVTSVNGKVGDVEVDGSGLPAASDAETETGTSTVVAVTPASGAATYLKKTGGTLTGALIGTISSFTTAIRAGASGWASTGEIRLPTLGAINWRNQAGNADIGGLSTNTSDQLQLATTTVPDSDNTKSLGASTKRWATVVTTALITGGTTPATSGAVRLNNNTGVVGRNAANNADVAVIGINTSDQAEVGTSLVGSSDALRTLGSAAVRWAGAHLANFVAIGTTPSTSGAVRVANNTGLASRNAGNTADVSVLVLNASDVATVGAPLTSTGEIIGTRFAPSTATGATVAARYFRGTTTGAPASGTWVAGDIVPGTDGTFWHCTVGGTPGTWVQSGSATYATLASLATEISDRSTADALLAPKASPTFTGTVTIPDATTATGAASLQQNAAALYGNGSDGNLTVSGSTTVTTDKYYDTLTVQNGGVLTASGARIFCKTLCQVDAGGIITANGGDGAAGGTAGTGANQGVYGLISAGGAGGTGAGSNGATVASGSGGAGAAGGAGSGGAGGAGGTFSTLVGNTGTTARTFPQSVLGHAIVNGSAANAFKGGSGGGGGGGDGTAGGGGGGGGGCALIAARSLVNNGTIRANGGAGGSPAAGNRGGGGGGGGGRLDVIYNTKTGSGTITATGGAAGVKTGTGVNGTAGADGLVNEIVNA